MENNKTIAYKSTRRIIYVGDMIGIQEVISNAGSFLDKRNKEITLLTVKCECGDIRNIKVSGIRKDTYGCLTCSNRKNKNKFKDVSGGFFGRMVNGAKKRNLEVSISPEDIYNLFVKQDRKCALSGIDLTLGIIVNKSSTASIDRIDSSKGYIIGNIQIVHKDINKMKMDFNQDYFINMCKLITKNHE